MGIEQFFFEVLDDVIVEATLSFQSTIRHSALALEQGEHLSHHLVAIHH